MKIDHVLIAFMIVVGFTVGIILTVRPDVREFRVPPYFWVLIALGLFELANFARAQGAAGTAVSMEARLLGFVLAIVLMFVVPLLAAPLVRPS